MWFPQLHDFNRARTVQYHISLAHALAVANYRRAYDEGAIRADAKIGMINCFTPVYTKQNPSEADLEAVRMTSGISNRWWLDLITKGELPADVLDSLAESGVKLPFRAAVTTTIPRAFRRRRARSTSTACRTLPTNTCGPTPL